jgi:hypothetical protein
MQLIYGALLWPFIQTVSNYVAVKVKIGDNDYDKDLTHNSSFIYGSPSTVHFLASCVPSGRRNRRRLRRCAWRERRSRA